jgi:hypothetical protein
MQIHKRCISSNGIYANSTVFHSESTNHVVVKTEEYMPVRIE